MVPVIDGLLVRGVGKPEYMVARHAGGNRNPLLIVELKRPCKWNASGRRAVLGQLRRGFRSTIYGLAGIGLHWTVISMRKDGPAVSENVLRWRADISGNISHNSFRDIIEPLIHNID